MWLDRFSSQPTPNGSPPPPQSRSFSPARRRPSHLAPVPPPRPGYNLRSSSLSLNAKANVSTISLSGTSRVPNGSTLIHELTPPPDVGNPLDILHSIIRSTVHHHEIPHSTDGEAVVEKPQTLTPNVEFGELSLQELVQSGKQFGQPALVPQHQESKQSVEECKYVCLTFEDVHTLLSEA